MATDQAVRLSRDEYLAFERSVQTRNEFADGRVRELRGNITHSLITGATTSSLHRLLKGRPYHVLAVQMRVKASDRFYYYPDVVVASSAARVEDDEADTLLDPFVIVEVTSPSTEAIDRGEKLDNYRRIASLTDYLIVAQDRVWVDHFHKAGDRWDLEDHGAIVDRVVLPGLGCELRLAEVYERVFPAQ